MLLTAARQLHLYCHATALHATPRDVVCTVATTAVFDPSNVRALFRRGVARVHLNAPGALGDMEVATTCAAFYLE